MGMRRMRVDKLGIDLLTHDPVVILKELDSSRQLPILIGPFEATAIALALEGTKVPRPLSHDLLRTAIEKLKSKVEKILIHDIQENTFFAKIIIDGPQGTIEIDARPSDGIALALRTNAPIYVSDQILLDDQGEEEAPSQEKETQEFRRFIEGLKPSDFSQDDN